MLSELRVRDLGVIADLTLLLGPGMTAVTGETGAGKTLLIEAIELLMGGRAETALVRPGAVEAVVDGRFVRQDCELVLSRTVPAGGGRSRAYVDGRMAPVGALAEAGSSLVDIHGQHAHQSLLAPVVQRAALDRFSGVDLGPLADARRRIRDVEAALAEFGGDARARAREVDLLRFQIAEVEAAGLDDPQEEERLAAVEEALCDAGASRAAADLAYHALAGEAGAVDAIGSAGSAIAGRRPLAGFDDRLRALQAEATELAAEVRRAAEALEEDPERLEAVVARRQRLRDLRRKYGDTLEAVLDFAGVAAGRLEELLSHEQRVSTLEAERARLEKVVAAEAANVAARRRAAAPELAGRIQAHLRELAMPHARFEVRVGGADPADEVVFLLAANPGDPPLPLTKVASGGELSRTMLASRLVLSDSPPTLVFDEVDAGIGGETAAVLGRSLAALAAHRQVLVVTHLPQVAAFADSHVAVRKEEVAGRSVATAAVLDDAGRVVELSRMLSGQPHSSTARDHAEELLASAARQRGRG